MYANFPTLLSSVEYTKSEPTMSRARAPSSASRVVLTDLSVSPETLALVMVMLNDPSGPVSASQALGQRPSRSEAVVPLPYSGLSPGIFCQVGEETALAAEPSPETTDAATPARATTMTNNSAVRTRPSNHDSLHADGQC